MITLFLMLAAVLRNDERDRKTTVSETAWALESSEIQPDRAADNSQLAARIQAAVEEMPERRRRVFELCYLEEFSLHETGDILGIKAKTVENHLALALRDLRTLLKLFRGG